MSFDGRPHASYALIGPYASHPNAPATGDALSGALEQAYTYGWLAGSMIGFQSYIQNWDVTVNRTVLQSTVRATTWVDIAKFKRYVPAGTARIVADAWVRGFRYSPFTTHLRVIVTDGTNTATGSEETITTDGLLDLRVDDYWPTSRRIGFAQATDPYRSPGWLNIRAGVLLAGATPAKIDGGTDITVTVQGYMDDEDSSGASPMWPDIISCWSAQQ